MNNHQPTGVVLVASTRAAAGLYPDRSGPILVEWLRSRGIDTPDPIVTPDVKLAETVADVFQHPPSVVLISGGTGLAPDDRSVEIIEPYLSRKIPGIAHAFWSLGMQKVPTSVLSRVVAGTRGASFIMALPGSTGAAKDATEVLDPLLDHLLGLLEGKSEH